MVARLRSEKGDVLPFRALFDSLCQAIPCELAFATSSLPRGSLQIVQPPKVNDAFLKAYGKEFHRHDRMTWEAIAQRKVVAARQCWPSDFESSAFFVGLLQPNGLRYAAAAPLSEPVLEGYGGAIEVYRTAEQGLLSEEELTRLGEFATEFDAAIARARKARRPGHSLSKASAEPSPLAHRPSVRQFIFDQHARPRLFADAFNQLDASLRHAMLDAAHQRLGQLNGKQSNGDRVSLPDSTGELWHFRVIAHHNYPALGDGPFVFFCLSPECNQWGALRSSDFAADAELSRLVPAIKFMQEEFHRGPTLHEIAKTVHLSPFHFHRRFTEQLGITPKHLLLDCQIESAKRMLVAREKELAAIATACGFAHQSHFTSRFKQATGLTPTRWRRVALEAQGEK